MDDNQLDELLHGIKANYERLPEYSDTKKIMKNLPQKKKRRKLFPIFPLAAIIAGLGFFFILALTTMDNHQQASFSKDYLLGYAEKKKEAFRTELGMETVDDFIVVERAEAIIEYYQSALSIEEMEEAKREIDALYKTPAQLVNEINKSNEKDLTEKWNQLFEMLVQWNYSLDNYFSDLKNDYTLDAENQAELLEMQYNYEGPIEIAEFIQMIHNQGFYIEKRHYQYQVPVEIRVNYAYIEQQITNFENHEGIQAFLNFLSEKMDLQNPGVHNRQSIPWYEFDNLFLELEDIYKKYQKDWGTMVSATNVLYPLTNYLNDYFSAGMGFHGVWSEEELETLKQELRSFSENHRDSIYWPIISSILKEYEANEWQVNRTYIQEELYYLFSDEAQNHEFDYIKRVDTDTITHHTITKYNLYKASRELSELKQNPIDMLSIYLHSFSADEELYKALYIGDGEQKYMDWVNIIEIPSLLVGNTINDSTIEYTFINMEYKPVASIQMVNDGDGWSISKQKVLE